MMPKLTFQPNLVLKSTFRTEVTRAEHRRPPRFLCNLLWAIDIAFPIVCHIITFSDGQTTLKLNCLSWIFTTFVANAFFNVVPGQFFAVPNAF